MRVLAWMNATETASGLYECWDLKRAKCASEKEHSGHRQAATGTSQI